ncbi:MAG: hypothetical protein JJ975_15715 [Bacteroidia bacterium]|nr:hypothetical protein [Bacteroidia bacterium]
MIVYKFKVVFEDVDDVERMIEVRANQTFRDLYASIIESIKFKPDTQASFFMSGDNWRKGREITNIGTEGVIDMADARLNAFVNDPYQKILLITNDELEWHLRISLFKIEKANAALVYPRCVKTLGEPPKQTKVSAVGKPTNEFEELVDEIVSEKEEPDVSGMGFDDEMDGSSATSEGFED